MITIYDVMQSIFPVASFVSFFAGACQLVTLPIFLIVFNWKKANSIPITQQLLKDTLRDGFMIVDLQNKVIDHNLGMKALLGEQVKIEIGRSIAEISQKLALLLNQLESHKDPCEGSILFESLGFIYEVKVYPIENGKKNLLGRMVIFHNVTERDHLEDSLRKNNLELSRTNTFFSALANLTVSLQTFHDPAFIMDTLGNELHKLGLKCFVTLYRPESNELVVSYLSESIETIRAVEKIIGRNILGFGLDRKHFSSLYQFLETKQIHYLPDEESGLKVFLGNIPGWVMDPLIKASAVSRHEPSIVIPLVANEKTVGLMGVWGIDLQEADIAPFQIFGSQIGWAIEKAILQVAEARRLDELSHSNSMITALSRVSSLIEITADNDAVYVSMGEELSKIGLSCAVVTLDELKAVATVRYVSLQSEILQKVQQLIGFTFVGRQISKKYWPGEKSIQEGVPIWYDNAEKVFKKLFPGIPAVISNRIYQLLKGTRTGQLCFLPLRIQGEVIGIMPIWGQNISARDNPTLSIFGDQMAAILRRNITYENEIRKSEELARVNSMIMALSGVASQLDSTLNLHQVLDTLGKELKKVNLNCMVGTIDDFKQTMTVEYITFLDDILRISQKIGLRRPEEIKIPRRLWPSDKAITEKTPTWDPAPIGNAYRMFPYVPKEIFLQTMRWVGWDLSEPVCYLPMINEEEVIGIFSVWGKGLVREDIPALSIFANQVATAIKNSRLFMKAQKEIDERIQAEGRIREALTEKEVLLKEVHHRVKNNLQVISSLLNLQAGQITDPYTLIALKESQNRVRSMALIHEKLYQSSDLAHIDLSSYLQSLVVALFQSYQVKAGKIELQVQAEKILMDLDTAIPCGLMVNELVTNSIKYAFPNDRSGKIQVLCSRRPDQRYSIIVRDDGIGLPPGFDATQCSSLGLLLVNSLTSQIDGELVVDSTKGTRFEITFARPEV